MKSLNNNINRTEHQTRRRSLRVEKNTVKLRIKIQTIAGFLWTFDQVTAFVGNDRINLKDITEFIRVITAASQISTLGK